MPIYEYICNDCTHEFESLQKFTDPPETVCPTCKGNVTRKLSQSAFHLRGSGWYSDGYGKKADRGSAKEQGTDGKTATEKSADGKTATEKSADGTPAKSDKAEKKGTGSGGDTNAAAPASAT